MKKYEATRKLYLANGAVLKTGDAVPDFEQWSSADQHAHLKLGFVRVTTADRVSTRTGQGPARKAAKKG